MNGMKIKNSLLLLLTATIWGVAFVAQSVGMDYVGPLTFNCVRSLLGGMVLIPCIWLLGRMDGKQAVQKSRTAKEKKKEQMNLLAGSCMWDSVVSGK